MNGLIPKDFEGVLVLQWKDLLMQVERDIDPLKEFEDLIRKQCPGLRVAVLPLQFELVEVSTEQTN